MDDTTPFHSFKLGGQLFELLQLCVWVGFVSLVEGLPTEKQPGVNSLQNGGNFFLNWQKCLSLVRLQVKQKAPGQGQLFIDLALHRLQGLHGLQQGGVAGILMSDHGLEQAVRLDRAGAHLQGGLNLIRSRGAGACLLVVVAAQLRNGLGGSEHALLSIGGHSGGVNGFLLELGCPRKILQAPLGLKSRNQSLLLGGAHLIVGLQRPQKVD